MPTWNFPELQSVLPCFPKALTTALKERFDLFGGIPSAVWSLPTDYRILESYLKGAIACLSTNSVQEVISHTTSDEMGFAIFHLEVLEDYSSTFHCFASPKVRHLVVSQIANRGLSAVATYVGITLTTPNVCGHFFEYYAHRILERGGSFRLLIGKYRVRNLTQCKLSLSC